MSQITGISWCDSTYNHWWGCQKVSAGCLNCYIPRTVPLRMRGYQLGQPRILTSEANRKQPFKWNKKPWVCGECGRARDARGHKDSLSLCVCGASNDSSHRRRVFAQSLGDWLDPEVPIEWLAGLLDTVFQCDQLEFILCSKRVEHWKRRLRTAYNSLPNNHPRMHLFEDWLAGTPPKNITVLTTAENQEMFEKRIVDLLRIPAARHGISAEPLLGPIDMRECPSSGSSDLVFNSSGATIDWVIVGGESGRAARPCNIDWIRDIVRQCKAAGVATFVKQVGSNPIALGGSVPLGWKIPRHPKGGDPEEWPEDLRVQEFYK